MISEQTDVRIVNKLGLHARASAVLVKAASTFDCEVRLSNNGKEVNGKSILGVMTLAASKGSMLRIIAKGQDAPAAVQVLADLISHRFGEIE